MLGDPTKLLDRVRTPSNLRRAFRYALRDRAKDHYHDPFELENARRNERLIIDELSREFKDPNSFTPRPAYAYFPPKDSLCFRRMVYIPFKDLVARYAFVIVIADLLDQELSPRCFANRRARGEFAQVQFLENFAGVSWPRFCKWQRKRKESGAFSVLVRTDISAFYDSISHAYLIQALEHQLALRPGSAFMKLFRKLLRIHVISYSHATFQPRQCEIMHQGLAIGNATEGVLANLYLKVVDEAMNRIEGVSFGRYNDDMRIFATDKETAKRARMVLQEHLLAKGLNLNSSKTRMAEGALEIEKLRGKAYEGYDYFAEADSMDDIAAIPVTDHPFDEFDRHFEPGQDFKEGTDARDFCHFLGRILTLRDRRPVHVDMLKTILTHWQGSSKYASWRLVETIVRDQCPAITRSHATNTLLACLADNDVSPYAKYRLLYYLSACRRRRHGPGVYRYLDKLGSTAKKEIRQMVPRFLGELAFELNIMALYVMKILGASHAEIEMAVRRHSPKPVAIPIKNVLILATDCATAKEQFALADASDHEGETDCY